MQTKYSKCDYLAAKKVIEDAEVIRSFISPTISVTTYKTRDGKLWHEEESHLEYPEDDYSLELVEARKPWTT
jgi:hypothetical protein